MLKGKNILLGITGSIAAYKSPLIIRELIKLGSNVRAIMTPAALEFITKLTISNLTKSPVISDMFEKDNQTRGAWHIHLAHWSDAMLIAPCTATTISRLATGLCDSALSTVAIALPKGKPLIIAPAMDCDMWANPITQNNIQIIKEFGVKIIPPEEGELASGLKGSGRLASVDSIITFLDNVFSSSPEEGKKDFKKSKIFEVKIKQEESKELADALGVEQAVQMPINTISDAVEKDKWSAELEYTKLKNSEQQDKKKV